MSYPNRTKTYWPKFQLGLAYRLVLQDLRLSEFRLMLLALVISVASIGSVQLFVDRIEQHLTQEAHRLMGADLILEGDRPLPEKYFQQARQQGLNATQTIQFPSMVLPVASNPTADRTSDATLPNQESNGQLAEVKAIAPGYPLRGTILLADAGNLLDKTLFKPTQAIPTPQTIWIDSRLATQLHAQIGEMLQIGNSKLRVEAILAEDPELGSGFLNLLPRCLINTEDLAATGLTGRGTRASYRLMVSGTQSSSFEKQVKPQLSNGQRIQSLAELRPETNKTLEQAKRFLSLASVSTLLIAIIGIALAARGYLQRHLDNAALMRCLGASRGQLLWLYTAKFLIAGSVASCVGLGVAWFSQEILSYLLGNLFGSAALSDQAAVLPRPHYGLLVQAPLIGLPLLLTLSLPVILNITHTPPTRVFRRNTPWFNSRHQFLYYLPALLFIIGLTLWQAESLELGLWMLAGFLGVGLVLNAFAYGLLVFCRLFPVRGYTWRYALAKLQRRWKIASLQIAGIGLTVMVLLLLASVRQDLLASWQSNLPGDAPNYFVINVQPEQLKPLQEDFAQSGWPEPVFYPMVRGRLSTLNDRKIDIDQYQSDRARRLVTREFNLSWSTSLPPGNQVTAGTWLAPASNNELSLEEGIAQSLQIQLGDKLTFDLGGIPVDFTVTSLRKVTWQSLRTNFFALVSPQTMVNFPATYVTSYHFPASGEVPSANGMTISSRVESQSRPSATPSIKQILKNYPNLLLIDIGGLITQVQKITDKISLAMEFLFGFSLIAGIFLLQIALASSLPERIHDLAILRTLGAHRQQLRATQLVEFLLLGCLAGALGAFAATGVGYFLATQVLSIPYQYNFFMFSMSILFCTLSVATLGWIKVRKILDLPPLQSIQASL